MGNSLYVCSVHMSKLVLNFLAMHLLTVIQHEYVLQAIGSTGTILVKMIKNAGKKKRKEANIRSVTGSYKPASEATS